MGKKKYGIKPLPIVHPLSQRETSRYKDIGFVTHKTGESFCEVLLRYMSDTATNSYKLSEITGISVASVYRYQRYDYLHRTETSPDEKQISFFSDAYKSQLQYPA